MKNVDKKDMKIDDLAVIVAKGFSAVDKRLDNVDKRLEELDDNIKSTRQEVLKVGDRFVPRYEFDNLLTRVIRIEQKLQGKHK